MAVLERGDCERLGGAGATERVELAARLEPLHDLTRGLLLLHERLQVPQRAAAAVEGLQDVIGVQRGGVGHEAVEFVREALLDAVVVAQPAEPSHHGVAERSLRVVRGLVGDVYPALPRPREVEAREVVRHPVRESLPGFKFHAANLPKHLADNLGHHLREARDRLAQVLDHDVVEHGLVRGPGQREHLAEQVSATRNWHRSGWSAGRGRVPIWSAAGMVVSRLKPGSNAQRVSAMYSSVTKRSRGPQSPASHRPSVCSWGRILRRYRVKTG